MAVRRLYLQAPVGNCTLLPRNRRTGDARGLAAVPGWSAHWFASGTMALAVALEVACARAPRRPARVVLAAYGCPDLVAAIRFAGAEPLYVDLEPGGFCMADAPLAEALSRGDVAAVVGVDLFGIEERWPALREAVARTGALLIQDCAQSVQPDQARGGGLHGDLVVFSFGRGKPVCLLGGGALLARDELASVLDARGEASWRASAEYAPRALRLRVRAYNRLLTPRCYSVLAAVMGSRLGRTIYEPLPAIRPASRGFALAADDAVECFWRTHRDRARELAAALSPLFARFPDDLATPVAPGASSRRVLSRFPVFIRDPRVRDRCIAALRARGIVATRMYERILPEIVDSHSPADGAAYPVARRVAAELVTLPVHARMRNDDIAAIAGELESCLLERA